VLRRRGSVIRQLPCPELAFAGTNRFWAVREQYDTPAYRAHCRRLAGPVARQIAADLEAGRRVVVIGIDGSPSMGVELTASDPSWGGRPRNVRDEEYPVSAGRGLFVQALLELLGEGVGRVRVLGLGQDLVDWDEAGDLAQVERELAEAP